MADVRVSTSSGSETVLRASDLDGLRSRFRGVLLECGEGRYDKARTIWNALIDHRPGLIACCTDAQDVVEAVQFARDRHLLVSVKGGGHNIAGKAVSEGGLMIDLSPMKAINVDPAARVVRAEPGVIGAELDSATQHFGLATPVGTVSTTGIAGLTLGGGQSWLGSKHGFAIDNLLSVDIVTADGNLRTVSAAEKQDLFWGVRGAGHNFGVVTSFEYRLHQVGPTVLSGMVLHPLSKAVDALRFYCEFTASQPDE